MARSCECPQCKADISDAYTEYDPSVGIIGQGWWCEACDIWVEDDDDGSDFLDEARR